MISYVLLALMRSIDKGNSIELKQGQVLFMACTEVLVFFIYIIFGLKFYNSGQVWVVILSYIFAVYSNFTAFYDWCTGYVYEFINLISLFSILFITSILGNVNLSKMMFFVLYAGILFVCERMMAFCRGDTEFLMVQYCFFIGTSSEDFAYRFMMITMLISAVLFDVFRRITGRREEMIPYTPFIFLSEIINIFMHILCIN